MCMQLHGILFCIIVCWTSISIQLNINELCTFFCNYGCYENRKNWKFLIRILTGGVLQGLFCSCILVHAPHPCNPSWLKPCLYLKEEQSSLIKRAFFIKNSWLYWPLWFKTTYIPKVSLGLHLSWKSGSFVIKYLRRVVYELCWTALLILCTKWITSKQQSSTLMSFIFKVMWFPVW